MLGYRLVYRYRVFVCARARIVLFIMEKIRSTGAFVPGRHTANRQIRNRFVRHLPASEMRAHLHPPLVRWLQSAFHCATIHVA